MLRNCEDFVHVGEYGRRCCWADDGDGKGSAWGGGEGIECLFIISKYRRAYLKITLVKHRISDKNILYA